MTETNICSKIVEELKKNPVENFLPLVDLTLEKSNNVEVYINGENVEKGNYKNVLVLWKGFKVKGKRIRDAFVVAESEEEVGKLLDLLGDEEEEDKGEFLGYTFFVKPEFSHVVEKRFPHKKKENFLLFTLTDKENFKTVKNSEHKVEKLTPEPEYIRQITRNWKYSDDDRFIKERMTENPFFGIKGEEKLSSYIGSFLRMPPGSIFKHGYIFLAFANTEEELRGKGMQKSVSSTMVEYSLEHGMVPLMYIVEGNEPSIRVAKSLGFEHVATHVNLSDSQKGESLNKNNN